MITFPSNGGSASGYLAVPQSGKGPGVVVIQEWWGLVDHIKDVCNRFAAAGFTALAPDLYDGQATKSPDEAGKMMMALNISEAEKKLRGAVEHLMRLENVSSPKAGVVGFCMGGQLALYAATIDRNVAATVDFYGIHPHVKPDFSKLSGPVLGIFAEKDKSVPQEAIVQLQQGHPGGRQDVRHLRLPQRGPRLFQRYAAHGVQRNCRGRRLGPDAAFLPGAPGAAGVNGCGH
jgi:carboxymethylenebutenolidase